jgi:hypothetical protein
MTTPDPTSLDRLHDVIAPPPVPWWPPAPGWYWVLAVLLVLALVLVLRTFLHWQHNHYRREALAEFEKQLPLLASDSTRASALTALSVLLKRTALTAFPRTEVASLTGPAWLAFLNRTAAMNGFTSDAGKLLEDAAYGTWDTLSISESRARASAELVHRWLLGHKGRPC